MYSEVEDVPAAARQLAAAAMAIGPDSASDADCRYVVQNFVESFRLPSPDTSEFLTNPWKSLDFRI